MATAGSAAASACSAAASRLGGLAPGCRRGQQLRELARALSDYHAAADLDGARGWASLDLFAAFLGEDPSLPEPENAAKWWSRIDVLVQVLVFVPILITWTALAAAALGARKGESILQAWEAGRVPGLALHDVALYTAVIVVALIGLTAVLAARRWRLEQAETRLRHELSEVLTMADLELSPLRIGITKQIARELDHAADKLAHSASAMEAAGQAASQTQQAASAAMTAAIPALADVQTAARASRDAAAELGTVPDRLARHLDKITTAVGDVAAADRAVAASVDVTVRQLSDSVITSAGDLRTSAGDLAAATGDSAARIAGALGSGAQELRDVLGSGADGLRDVLGDVAGAAAGYASQTEVAADIIGQAHQALADLPEAVRGLRDGVSDIGGQLTELAAAMTAVKEAAALLLESVAVLRDQPPSLAGAGDLSHHVHCPPAESPFSG